MASFFAIGGACKVCWCISKYIDVNLIINNNIIINNNNNNNNEIL
jgi:hypothetical protein